MAELARAGLALVLIWALGALLLAALGLRRRRRALAIAQPGMDFAAGCALLATVWTLAALAGWPVRPSLVLAVVAALALPVCLRAIRGRGRQSCDSPPALHSAIPLLTLITIACLILAFAWILIRAWRAPMFWDGRYIWAFKAKAMFVDRRLDRDAFTNLARYAYSHLDYPLAVPAAQAWVYQIIGGVDERAANLVGLVYWLGIVLVLASYLRRWMALPWAAGIALLGCQLPLIAYHAGGGAADVPLAFCYLAAAVLLVEWVEEGRREDCVLAALMFGVCSLVKAEGLTMALGGALAFAWVWVGRWRRVSPGGAALGVLALGLPYLPWAVLRACWRIPSLQLSYLHSLASPGEVAARLKTILGSLVMHFTSWQRWELAWGFTAVGLVAFLASPRRAGQGPILLWALFFWQLGVYVVNYALSHYEITQYLATSLDRVLIHLLPLALAAAARSLAREARVPASAPVG